MKEIKITAVLKLSLLVVSVLLLGAGCARSNQDGISNYDTNDQNSRSASDSINLSNQGLTKVPEYIFNQTSLEELDLSNNRLTGAIQSQVGNLKNLKTLKANNNLMTGIPAEIGQLQSLEVLDLSNNQITGLPYELGNLKNLKILNISGNNYSKLDLDNITKNLPANINIIK